MAKVIKYKFMCGAVNRGTEDNPRFEQKFLDKELICRTEAEFDENLPIAQAEAYKGEYTVEGEFDSDPESPAGDAVTWEELDTAYQEGVDSL